MIASSGHTSTGVTVWLSGGVAESVSIVTITVVTAGGRTFERDVSIFIGENIP